MAVRRLVCKYPFLPFAAVTRIGEMVEGVGFVFLDKDKRLTVMVQYFRSRSKTVLRQAWILA